MGKLKIKEFPMSEIFSKLNSLPDFITSHDLVELGLYSNPDAVYVARSRGNSPDFIKIGRLVKYPKAAVAEFIKTRLQSGSQIKE